MTEYSILRASDRFFEDFTVGEVIEGGDTYVMSEARMIAFAAEFDPQDFHTDPDVAKESVYGGLIASGWHTGSAMMRLITEFTGETSMGSPGVDEVRWLMPVRDGDELRLRMTTEATRRSSSKPDRGFITFFQELLNQEDAVVMSMKATMMIRCRYDAPPTPDRA